jgi:hypothetical protein
MSIQYLPSVKPSAIALGTVFTQGVHMAVLAPVFGEVYDRSKRASSTSQFLHSREATTSAALFGGTLLGAGIQTYALAAILNATGTLSYKGAMYTGGLVWACHSVGGIIGGLLGFGAEGQAQKRDASEVLVGAVAGLMDTVGLGVFLTWWGTRTLDF